MVLITQRSYAPISWSSRGPGWVAQPGLHGASGVGICEPLSEYHPGDGFCPVYPGAKLSGCDMLRWGNPRCDFLIRQKIGWGAESTVWLVQDARERFFVLKALRGNVNIDLDCVPCGEFKIMKKLGRLNAAFLHQPDNLAEKYLCLVMPPLGDSLHSSAPVAKSAASISTFIRTLWDQLRYLHDRGICHGDISPGNVVLGLADDALTKDSLEATFGSDAVVAVQLRKVVSPDRHLDEVYQTPPYMPLFLVRRNGRGAMKSNKEDMSLARIIDFGRSFEGPSMIGTSGTPGYTAPELDADGDYTVPFTGEATQKSDLWSLGCTIAYGLTNETYFPDPPETSIERSRVRYYTESPNLCGQMTGLNYFLGAHSVCLATDWHLHTLVLNILNSMIRLEPAQRHHTTIEHNIRALEWYTRTSAASYYARILAREMRRFVRIVAYRVIGGIAPRVFREVEELRSQGYSSRPGALRPWPWLMWDPWMSLRLFLVDCVESWK